MRLLNRFFRPRAAHLDVCWLTDDLALRPAPGDGDWTAIRQAGIRAVVDLRAEAADNTAIVTEVYDLRYLRLPIAEYEAPGDSELRLVTDWITERISAHEPVMVHCREGRGRSALVACATLIRLGLPTRDAYRMLLRARPQASLSKPQEELLQRFGETFAPDSKKRERG